MNNKSVLGAILFQEKKGQWKCTIKLFSFTHCGSGSIIQRHYPEPRLILYADQAKFQSLSFKGWKERKAWLESLEESLIDIF